MDLPHVHPGLATDQILVLQGDHRSAYVCEGHLLDQTLRPRRPDDLWDFLRERDLHPCVVHRLRATGFLRIFEIGWMQLDWSLITALIERWRPETYIFHLPTGETTITLQDVQILYGLHVDGLADVLPQYMRAMMHPQYLDLLGQYTGFRPQGEAAVRGGSRISVTAIRQHMEVLHPDITCETEDLHIHWYMRLALFLLFGGVLFPNTLGNLVSLRFLHHLQQLDELLQYSWGAAVLAYLYMSMCRASMGTQVWAWERILPLQPPLPPLEPGVAPPFLPLATRWVLWRGNYRGSDAHHNLPIVKDVLDILEAGQFIWTTYSNELLTDLPDYCSVD
uniref:Serine/threonine-protein phosphatase 7 long form homolog n=1 Tax=Nicotiana sylvestris TaxID=4096 RepID=A0A1U7VSF5_NICSY|nr:PREDICTED: serine/threonine-protein phosphatase 7 long form homolog [Nicotiana sylvestris]